MKRLLLCLPRSAKCADIRQIERCIDGLHVELLLSVLLAMACPVVSSLSVPYIAYALSLPYMCVSVALRVLTKAATGSFRAVESLNRVFKAIGAANVSLSGFSLILCGVSTGTGSNWLYVVSLCLYTLSLVFHIFVVTFAMKMYSMLRDEQIAVGGRCVGRARIPDTCIDEIYNAQKIHTTDNRDTLLKGEGFVKRNNGVTGVLQQLELDTPMDSSSACVSATAKEHKLEQQETVTQVGSSTSSILAEVTPTPVNMEKDSVCQSTPITATSPNKTNFPDLQNTTNTTRKTGDTLDATDVLEEQPMDAMTAAAHEHTDSHRQTRGCMRCGAGQCSTPIARYSQLSPESDSTVP